MNCIIFTRKNITEKKILKCKRRKEIWLCKLRLTNDYEYESEEEKEKQTEKNPDKKKASKTLTDIDVKNLMNWLIMKKWV